MRHSPVVQRGLAASPAWLALILIWTGTVLAAPANQAEPISLSADHIEYNLQTGSVVANGHVNLTQPDQIITADRLAGNLENGHLVAEGHASLAQTVRDVGGTTAAPRTGDQSLLIMLSADEIELDARTAKVLANGHVRATQRDQTITSEHLSANVRTGEVQAQGDVTLVLPEHIVKGSALNYNYRTRAGEMQNVDSRYQVWHVTGRALEVATDRDVGHTVALTPCDPRHPALLLKSNRVIVAPGDHLTAYQSTLYVYGVPIAYLPVYTTSLAARQGPDMGVTIGYTPIDGLFAEYRRTFPLGSVTDRVRLRYGSLSSLTAESIATERATDHVWSLHVGRQDFYDLIGNLEGVEHTSLSLIYDAHHMAGIPISYVIEASYGDYHELLTGVDTTRAHGVLTLSGDAFKLADALSGGASMFFTVDRYGTGQERDIVSAQAAVSKNLGAHGLATISYNFVSVTGVNPPQFITNGGPFDPFAFDALGPQSVIAATYSYFETNGLLRFGTFSAAYEFDSAQTTAYASANMQISPSILFTMTALYNLSQSQLTEVEYAVTATCDCLSVGLLYRTFPSGLSNSSWFVTLGVNTLSKETIGLPIGGFSPRR